MVNPAELSATTSVLVGLIALAMAVLAVRARGRSNNRRLLFVAAAFAVFSAKSFFSAYNVSAPIPHPVPHDMLEFTLSLFDLVIIVLLVLPFLLKKA